VTASFGFASSPPVGRVEDLLAAADSALYRAKDEGKNRVVQAVIA
jgi:PleD family two-component response regulator